MAAPARHRGLARPIRTAAGARSSDLLVVGLVVFIVGTAHRTSDGDLRLFAKRGDALADVTLFAVLSCFSGMLLVITQYLPNVRGASPAGEVRRSHA